MSEHHLKFRFNEALDFPCDQHMRIVVVSSDEEPAHLIEVINKILPDRVTVHDVLDSRPSQTGKYVSYNVRIRFDTAKEIELLYEILGKQDFVKHVL